MFPSILQQNKTYPTASPLGGDGNVDWASSMWGATYKHVEWNKRALCLSQYLLLIKRGKRDMAQSINFYYLSFPLALQVKEKSNGKLL